MTWLLALTICGGLVATILVLSGWGQITRNATFDDSGAGPLKLEDPFELPEQPHYGTTGSHLRAFRKKRTRQGRDLMWETLIRPKVQPLIGSLHDEEGQRIELADHVGHPQFEAMLSELERRAGLPPLPARRSTNQTPTQE